MRLVFQDKMKELEAAIKILENTKKILFLTGAGMSADSGIPTFRDINGFWNNFPVYKEKELDPIDLANGNNFLQFPEESWGFYEWRRRNAHQNKPHEGYDMINKFLEIFDGFLITTNTDGYHLRSGTPKNKIYEIHGSMWRLQSLNEEDKYIAENHQVPLCDLDDKTMLVKSESMPRMNGFVLRPNILMFYDAAYIHNLEQQSQLTAFGTKNIDTVILIGSDVGVPTNVSYAADYQREGSKVICINPNPNCNGDYLTPDVHIKKSAKEALIEIEKFVA